MGVGELVLSNLVIAVMAFLGLWVVSLRTRDASFIDAFWAYGMVLLVITSFLLAEGGDIRRIVITALVTVWGLRLGTHLFLRWKREGKDKRYRNLFAQLEKRGLDFSKASLLAVFLPQSILMWAVSLPAQIGQTGTGLGPVAWIGIGLALAGIAIESLADLQLSSFKARPENAGKVMDKGLWRYSRHPNYFGDFCTWWGVFLVCVEVPGGWWALPGPLFLSWTLLRWSGAPLLERGLKESRPDYAAYIERTPGFFPWFPKSG